jgi:hypothetical protein
MDRSANYTVEIDGQVVGTVNGQNFNDAAMAVMWSYTTQCTTLVVYRADKPEQTCLYVGVEMTSRLNMHSRRFTSFQRRSDLDTYLQALR